MSRLRPPAVSGLFYPDSPHELRSMVQTYLDQGRGEPESGGGQRALIAPHAGYVYSGPIAGSSFRQLIPGGPIERVVLLGPSHHFLFDGLALPDADAFSTPLGDVPIDAELRERIEDLPQVIVSDPAHAQEHSLEVELPFLQEIFGEGFGLLPLVVGSASAESVAEVLDRVWIDPRTLVVISSDLSHYLTYAEAATIDGETARRILELDGSLTSERACGATPINGLLLAASRRGLTGRLLDLRNSGDTAGDRRRVVGYGAFELGAGL